jgi:hypothetical protein
MLCFEHFRLLISHLRVAPGFEAALNEKRQVEYLRAMPCDFAQWTRQKISKEVRYVRNCTYKGR